VPILLRDEEGVAHVRTIFRRMRRPGNLGPRGLDPDDTLEVRDEHEPAILQATVVRVVRGSRQGVGSRLGGLFLLALISPTGALQALQALHKCSRLHRNYKV
jgi:hypothetical protein